MKKIAAVIILACLLACTLTATVAAQEPITFAPVPVTQAALGRAVFGLVQLVITFVLSIAVVYGSYRLLGWLVRGLDITSGLARGSVAMGIMMASFLFGIVLLMKRSLYPVFTVLKDLAFEPESNLVALGSAALCALGYVAVSFAVAVAIALASLWLFDRLTREIKEMEEIRRDNVAVAIFFSGVFLSMAYFMEAGLHGLLVTLIPVMGIGLPSGCTAASPGTRSAGYRCGFQTPDRTCLRGICHCP
ncbi:MAG: DUF350 domain-containing protein [Spirochaetota bacterium]